jgi:hypothetical protein
MMSPVNTSVGTQNAPAANNSFRDESRNDWQMDRDQGVVVGDRWNSLDQFEDVEIEGIDFNNICYAMGGSNTQTGGIRPR